MCKNKEKGTAQFSEKGKELKGTAQFSEKGKELKGTAQFPENGEKGGAQFFKETEGISSVKGTEGKFRSVKETEGYCCSVSTANGIVVAGNAKSKEISLQEEIVEKNIEGNDIVNGRELNDGKETEKVLQQCKVTRKALSETEKVLDYLQQTEQAKGLSRMFDLKMKIDLLLQKRKREMGESGDESREKCSAKDDIKTSSHPRLTRPQVRSGNTNRRSSGAVATNRGKRKRASRRFREKVLKEICGCFSVLNSDVLQKVEKMEGMARETKEKVENVLQSLDKREMMIVDDLKGVNDEIRGSLKEVKRMSNDVKVCVSAWQNGIQGSMDNLSATLEERGKQSDEILNEVNKLCVSVGRLEEMKDVKKWEEKKALEMLQRQIQMMGGVVMSMSEKVSSSPSPSTTTLAPDREEFLIQSLSNGMKSVFEKFVCDCRAEEREREERMEKKLERLEEKMEKLNWDMEGIKTILSLDLLPRTPDVHEGQKPVSCECCEVMSKESHRKECVVEVDDGERLEERRKDSCGMEDKRNGPSFSVPGPSQVKHGHPDNQCTSPDKTFLNCSKGRNTERKQENVCVVETGRVIKDEKEAGKSSGEWAWSSETLEEIPEYLLPPYSMRTLLEVGGFERLNSFYQCVFSTTDRIPEKCLDQEVISFLEERENVCPHVNMIRVDDGSVAGGSEQGLSPQEGRRLEGFGRVAFGDPQGYGQQQPPPPRQGREPSMKEYPSFDGRDITKMSRFFEDFETLANRANWDTDTRLRNVKTCLKGYAFALFEEMDPAVMVDYEKGLEAFQQALMETETPQVIRHQFRNIRQGKGEDICAYFERLEEWKKLVVLQSPRDREYVERDAVDVFIQGLEDMDVAKETDEKVHELRNPTLFAAVKIARIEQGKQKRWREAKRARKE